MGSIFACRLFYGREGELLLTIMAGIAQEDNRSISENGTRWKLCL